MKKLILIIIFTWYFVHVGHPRRLPTAGHVIGPFNTLSQCEKIRDQLYKNLFGSFVSSCWKYKN